MKTQHHQFVSLNVWTKTQLFAVFLHIKKYVFFYWFTFLPLWATSACNKVSVWCALWLASDNRTLIFENNWIGIIIGDRYRCMVNVACSTSYILMYLPTKFKGRIISGGILWVVSMLINLSRLRNWKLTFAKLYLK